MRYTWLLLVLSACTFEWNDQQPPFPLTGEPPPLSSFPKLNQVPSARAQLMQGPDGAYWTAFCEYWMGGSVNRPRDCKRMHLWRLSDPMTDEIIDADRFANNSQTVFVIHEQDMNATTARTIALHQPGTTGDPMFTLPGGTAVIYPNSDGTVFVYWVIDPVADHLDVYRRDQSYHLTVPVPAGIDPRSTAFDFLLTKDGGTLVVRDPTGQMTAWSTTTGATVDLGMRPESFTIDDEHAAILTIGDDGFHQVPLAGGPDRLLFNMNFDPGTLELEDTGAFFASNGLWQVPLDGSGPAMLVEPTAARLLTLGPSGEIVYSRDDRLRYVGGAGDGWLGTWNFMQRGFGPTFSAYGDRIDFLEHAATIGNYGDLTSVRIPNGAPTTLAINVHDFAELPDNRVLAIENAIFPGTWNRLVVIDEKAQTKRWVAPQAADFLLAPDGRELVVDLVTGASGYDIVRVPIP